MRSYVYLRHRQSMCEICKKVALMDKQDLIWRKGYQFLKTVE